MYPSQHSKVISCPLFSGLPFFLWTTAVAFSSNLSDGFWSPCPTCTFLCCHSMFLRCKSDITVLKPFQSPCCLLIYLIMNSFTWENWPDHKLYGQRRSLSLETSIKSYVYHLQNIFLLPPLLNTFSFVTLIQGIVEPHEDQRLSQASGVAVFTTASKMTFPHKLARIIDAN